MPNNNPHATRGSIAPPAVGWTRNEWLPLDHLSIGLDDLGLLQGVVLVDRLRTGLGRPLDCQAHVARLLRNCQEVGVAIPLGVDLVELITECVYRNVDAFFGQDFCVVTLVTPGRRGVVPMQPTIIVHPASIAWEQLDRWYELGQALIVAGPRNIPADCWSPTIKTRARLQYYLADQQASSQHHDQPAAVLLDTFGNLTETSTANLLLVEDSKRLVAPPVGTILEGIGLQRTLAIAQRMGITVAREPISPDRARAATELLLCGSTAILWRANRLDKYEYSVPQQDSFFLRLKRGWVNELGFDYVAQAQAASELVCIPDMRKQVGYNAT
jgi:branched-chain amino acid aminotransferase